MRERASAEFGGLYGGGVANRCIAVKSSET